MELYKTPVFFGCNFSKEKCQIYEGNESLAHSIFIPESQKKKNTMSTLLNRFTLLVSFAFSAFGLQAADKNPPG